jgi:hypothetical protein
LRSFPVRECLLRIVNEEWEHRLYAERDLIALRRATHSAPDGRADAGQTIVSPHLEAPFLA